MKHVYEPLQTLKPVGEKIWIADGPVVSFYGLPYPTRMVVVQLANGNVIVHSPIQSTPGLLKEIDKLGAVEAIIAPNFIHYVSVPEWAKIYPDAKIYYAPGVVARAKKHKVDLPTGEEFIDQNPWLPELEALLVQGSTLQIEIVLFHKPSRVLVLTDLIENFEADKVNAIYRPFYRMAGIMEPNGSMPRDMRHTFRHHLDELRAEIEMMIARKPERVIIAHGKWFDRDGTEALKRSFSWLLEDEKAGA